jgi:hypothetical protein
MNVWLDGNTYGGLEDDDERSLAINHMKQHRLLHAMDVVFASRQIIVRL